MEEKEAHVGKMETRLKQWGAKLDAFMAKAEEAGAEMKIDYRKHLDDLKAKHKAAQSKLDELKAARGEEWKSFMAGVESAGNELEAAFKKLTD